MTRGIFIAGNDSTLSRAVEAAILNKVDQYAAALIPNRLTEVQKTAEPDNIKRISLDWNPASPLSARALVLAAENHLEHIDEVILICSPPSIRCNPEDLPPASVEIMLNDNIKGWFFLIKEITAVFKERGRGTLALVYPDNNPDHKKNEAADVLGPAALASFRALTQGLLASAYNEPYITVGFSASDSGNDTAFASFINKNIDELTLRSKGKLFKFGKFNFFR